jgi:hypothetical protein
VQGRVFGAYKKAFFSLGRGRTPKLNNTPEPSHGKGTSYLILVNIIKD